MSWKVEYLPEAEKDLKGLDGSQRNLVLKAIKKVQQNPLPVDEQGYGKPLGNHNSTNLAGLLKIKLRSAGLRIVYQLERLLQMADKTHFCGEFATFSYRFCESPISAVKKAKKKYRTDTFDLYGT